uniref:GPI transamidase component PIG-T n=1 Tax=Glossina austeni TaxID=7395 RepID=A0A1A9VNM5_GLOAU
MIILMKCALYLSALTICGVYAQEAVGKIEQEQSHPSDLNDTPEEFHEELYVQPMGSGFVNTYFQFTTKWFYKKEENLHNIRLVPRSIAEILLQYDIKELHISLTQGLWRYESWGYPIKNAPPGAEVWAWFAAENLDSDQVDDQWTRVASTLSGILCASLNFIDHTNTLIPKYGFRPQFISAAGQNFTKHLRYSSLPREIVCTENLTPWKKLLPCNSKNGFASLLNSVNVYNTNYHSLAVRVRTFCLHKNECFLEFTESANLVYDSKMLTTSNTNDFSLRRLFGQGLNGHCPLAKSSKVYVNLNSPTNYELNPSPQYNVSSTRGSFTSHYGVYDIQQLKGQRLFNIAWFQRKASNSPLTPPPLCVHRYIVGQGQERGKLVTQLANTHYSTLRVILQENIPWFMPIYMHTLKIRNQRTAELIKPKTVNYYPGVQRKRPYHLELLFYLPSQTSVEISFDFDYIFLKWLEYPPDANHGHYVGSAVITTQLPLARNYTAIPAWGTVFADSFNASESYYLLQLRTESLLLSLPTPDFSMPYNVICLACTVVALAFGPIHSIATKRIIIEENAAASATFYAKILQKLKRKPKTSIKQVISKRKEDKQPLTDIETAILQNPDNVNSKSKEKSM